MADKAFTYYRESDDDPAKTVSLPKQLFLVDQLRENNLNIPVIEAISEKKSAKAPGIREGFLRMMSEIEIGNANIIFCWKANRLCRNPREAGWIIQLVDEGKLKIITCYGTFDRSNAKMLWEEFKDSSEYSKNLSKDVIESVDRKVREGVYPSKAKWGYKNYAPDLRGPRYIIPDPDRWEGVKEFVELMLTGLYPVEKALNLVNAKGLTNSRGRKMSLSQATVFLRDPFMTGHFTLRPERFKGKLFKASVTPPNNQKPMVSMGQWLKLQKILNGRVKRKGSKETRLTFQGMPKCEECGYTITGEIKTKRYLNCTTQLICYYRCTKKGKIRCSQRFLNEISFNQQVETYIDDLAFEPQYAPVLHRIMDRREVIETDNEDSRAGNRTKRLNRIKEDRRLLAFQKMHEMIDDEDFEKQKKELDDVEAQINQEDLTDKNENWDRLIDDVINFAANVKTIYNDDGDDFVKQMVLKIIGSNLVVGDKKLKIEAKDAFIALKALKNLDLDNEQWLEPQIGRSDNLNHIFYRQTPELWTVQGSNL